MDLAAEKYKLMEWLISIEDESIVKRHREIKNETSVSGESYKISNTERLFLEAGLKDLKEGNVFSHKEVMREVKEKYGI